MRSRVRIPLALVVTIPVLCALVACGGNDDSNSTDSVIGGPVAGGQTSATSSRETVVQMGQSFHLAGNAYGQGEPAGMTFVVEQVVTAPICEQYDSGTGGYAMLEQPFIAIEFDVSLDSDSADMSFGSPDWFRAKDPDGYVTDDLTILSGACDDAYPEFTSSDLSAGDKHMGWVMFQDEKLKPGDELSIGWPYGDQSVSLTVPQ